MPPLLPPVPVWVKPDCSGTGSSISPLPLKEGILILALPVKPSTGCLNFYSISILSMSAGNGLSPVWGWTIFISFYAMTRVFSRQIGW